MNRARAIRRNYPIHGYVGPNGSGKSANAVLDTVPSLRTGRQVLSTVRMLDGLNPRPCEGYRLDTSDQLDSGKPVDLERAQMVDCPICVGALADPEGEVFAHRQAHPLWVPFTSWTQLLAAKRCDVLMDEVTGIASSRESHGMPSIVANKLVQMRRDDVVIRWTAPSWARADKIIRECSQAVTYSTGHFSKVHRDEEGQRAWRNRRLSRARTYDAQMFEDFTVGKREQLKPWCVSMVWLPRSGAFDWYDSFDSVLTIGTVNASGTCERCGGSRPRQKCSCAPDAHDHGDGPLLRLPDRTGAEAAKPRPVRPAPGGGRRVRALEPTSSS